MIGLARRYAFGHVRFVESDAELVHECLVLQAVFPYDVAHGIRHGAVGRRPDGDPLIRQGKHGLGDSWVDHDDGDALFLALGQGVVYEGAEVVFRRIVTPENDQIRVQNVVHVVGAAARPSVGDLHHVHDAGTAVAVAGLEPASVQPQEPAYKAVSSCAGRNAGCVGHIAGSGTEALLRAADLLRHGLLRLFPGDSAEQAFAAFASAHHGIAQAVGGQEGVAVGTAALAAGKGQERLFRFRGKHAALLYDCKHLAFAAAVVDVGDPDFMDRFDRDGGKTGERNCRSFDGRRERTLYRTGQQTGKAG